MAVTVIHWGKCSCGYTCSATSVDSAEAALFAHVVHCHTVPPAEPTA